MQQTSTQTYQRDKGVRLLYGATHSYTRLGATRNHTPGPRKPSSWRQSHIHCGWRRTILSSDNILASHQKYFSKGDIKCTKRKGSRSKNSSNSAIPKHGLYITLKLYFDDNISHNARLYTQPYSESVTCPCKSFGVAFLVPPEQAISCAPGKPEIHSLAHCLIFLSSVFIYKI